MILQKYVGVARCLLVLLVVGVALKSAHAAIPLSELKIYQSLEKVELIDAKGYPRGIGEDFLPSDDPALWSQKDFEQDNIPGTSTERAFSSLKLVTPSEPIIVAVIDSGVQITHPDLAGLIWTNSGEIADNGMDDDKNGYIDDVHGWNFLGNVDAAPYELTREYKRLKKLFDAGLLDVEQKKVYNRVKFAFESKLLNAKLSYDRLYPKYSTALEKYKAALEILFSEGLTKEDEALLQDFTPTSEAGLIAKDYVLLVLQDNYTLESLTATVAQISIPYKIWFNVDYDLSAAIGDHADQLDEKGYGNNDVEGPDARHGTHCAGIIAGLRNNGIGANGQTNFVRIMSLRAVPDGDERDKDVANAIRYAVDHGARVVSMSFGKDYSPEKAYVDEAVKYAASHGVLLVHASGNNGHNTDQIAHFPTPYDLQKEYPLNWMDVGASAEAADSSLPAYFSNYGKKNVALFAPGVSIYSSVTHSGYASMDGTSMATPQVAGVAALVLSQAPSLTAVHLRKALMDTVTTFPGLGISVPTKTASYFKQAQFSDLSITGGIVNAYQALLAVGVQSR